MRPGSTPSTSTASADSTSSALEALLIDLGPQIQRGASISHSQAEQAAEGPQHCATGLVELDARLGGGFPRGRLSEICGPPSSGRTALALTLVGATLRQGSLAGWIDLADAFDPISASASGVDLERLLWIRPRSQQQALRSCDRLLQTEGFELIVFDCVLPGRIGPAKNGPGNGSDTAQMTSIRDVAWLRLSRLAAKTRTALVVLSQTAPSQTAPSQTAPPQPASTQASATGSRAELVLEMQPLGARFVGPPSLLETLETTVVLRRHRTRPSGIEIPISIHVEEDAAGSDHDQIDVSVDPER
jgi:hypothetical protein